MPAWRAKPMYNNAGKQAMPMAGDKTAAEGIGDVWLPIVSYTKKATNTNGKGNIRY